MGFIFTDLKLLVFGSFVCVCMCLCINIHAYITYILTCIYMCVCVFFFAPESVYVFVSVSLLISQQYELILSRKNVFWAKNIFSFCDE
jgi:hypothetical protein